MSSRVRRVVLIVLAAVTVWYVAIVVGWAARPLDDTVPVGNLTAWEEIDRAPGDPAPVPIGVNVVETREVRCNSLFDRDAFDDAPQDLPFPQAFNREPCTLMRSNARLMFVVDTIVLVAAFAVGVAVLLRARRHRDADVTDPAPSPPLTGAPR